MNYERYRAKRETEKGEIDCALQNNGGVLVTINPNHLKTGWADYYYITSPHDCSLILSAQAADNLMAVIGECLIEKRRQEVVARGLPVTDGNGMEAITPPTDVVPVLAIHREYAEIGGEG